jgi:tripartite-type tricarboxylate transporter receptor subunit TctC
VKVSRIVSVVCVVLILAVFLLAPAATEAAEKNFIRLIVPHAPGAGVDVQARQISERLAKGFGKPVVVENMPGAGGIKGIQEIIRGPKDGSTIGMVASNLVINPSLYRDVQTYDPVKDITPISVIGFATIVVVTNPSLPVRNIKELIALAKSQPGKLNYGSAGNGTVLHLAGELFCSEAGVKITHVPYKGGSQLISDVMGGHVEMSFLAQSSCIEQIKAGKLRALAVSTAKRSAQLPDVPTLVEAGLANYHYAPWVSMIGPAQLPQPIVKQLHSVLKGAVEVKEILDKFAAQGTTIVLTSAEEAARIVKDDFEQNARLIKQSGAKAD